MPSRPDIDIPRGPGFLIHQDTSSVFADSNTEAFVPYSPDAPPMPSRQNTLSPASPSTMNSRSSPAGGSSYYDTKHEQPASGSGLVAPNNSDVPRRMLSTIRPVSSIDEMHRTSAESRSRGSPSGVAARADSGFASSVNSNTSAFSSNSQSQLQVPNGRDKTPRHGASALDGDTDLPGYDVLPRSVSPRLGTRPAPGRGSVEIPERDSSLGSTAKLTGALGSDTPHIAINSSSAAQTPNRAKSGHSQGKATDAPSSPAEPAANDAATPTNGNNWDGAVGKAGLGKTGRVINKLVSDNESLKRDIKIEKLKADEARQSARLLEDKMDRVISDYESRLLEATVTKTLLARKERQVESLQAAVELERERTSEARKREATWREQMEHTRDDSKRAVEEATNHAMLLEGRYNAISGHWRDQGNEVNAALTRMRKEIAELSEERLRDDEKIATLRDLCDQQDGNIRELLAQKEAMARQFEAYKAEQERALHDIKAKAAQREREHVRNVEESKEVLDKLKWALNVREKIEWAQ